jgi:membrane protease YdiL (CAAX protease family)
MSMVLVDATLSAALIFVGALVAGWLRMKSGSIIGPWVIHASVNVAMSLSIALRSAA